MPDITKFFSSLLRGIWGILNPNLNPLRNAPVFLKYFVTILLALFWSLAFGLYTKQFLYISYNMLAHIAVISMGFITWYTFRYFSRTYPDSYPLMRDPNFSPKCYEMTDAEKQQAVNNADELLKK